MSQTKIVELANVIEWEEGWDFIQEGIEKVQRILEGQQESFSAEENMMLYTLVYNMCSQRPPHSYEQQLYDKYKETLDEYISSMVLPALRDKHDAEFMLKELVKRWENHKLMVVRLSRFFHYLERSFVLRMSLPSLNEVGLTCFHDLVYQELCDKAINAVIVLIEKEREGEQIDRALLKNNLDIFVGIGNWKMEYYVNDFEVAMLRDTASYYSRKASSWIEEYSYSDYLLKAEECLKKEKDRVSHYLHVSSETKLLEIVKNELLVYTNPLLKKEHSGFRALLIDDKVASMIQMSRTKIVELENVIEWEEGWDFIQEGIKKVMRILEGQQESFSTEENMMLYSLIYNMCSQKCPLAEQLYDKYKEALDEYINSTVLPALREKHDSELMLRELVKRWENHKLMVMRLSRFFYYLDRYFIPRKSLPSLNQVGLTCFRDLVYQELRGKAINAVIVLIGKERDGEQIDRALLKNVLDIFVGIGNWNMEYYVNDFEDAMLRDTAAYYSRKASCWIVEDSYPDYMLKAEECLKKEKDRVSHYLHVSSETKLLEKVKNELLVVYTNQLLEKEHSGSRALLRDDKAESSGSFGQMIP